MFSYSISKGHRISSIWDHWDFSKQPKWGTWHTTITAHKISIYTKGCLGNLSPKACIRRSVNIHLVLCYCPERMDIASRLSRMSCRSVNMLVTLWQNACLQNSNVKNYLLHPSTENIFLPLVKTTLLKNAPSRKSKVSGGHSKCQIKPQRGC